MRLLTADAKPISIGLQVYAVPGNLQMIPHRRAGKVVGINLDSFPGGIVLVHWNGSRLVAMRQATRSGGWRFEMRDFDINVQSMRPAELLSASDAVARLV